jgi:two-component system, chemotaxis family, chemotaxis protein CheY
MVPQSILIVDDSSSIRNILRVYLMGLKVEVLDADTGERALQLARLVPLSLMIADIQMPGMDGLTLVDRIRHDPRAQVSRLPVVLLTSDRSEAARVRMREVGANDLLYKPISAETLRAVTSRFLTKADP